MAGLRLAARRWSGALARAGAQVAAPSASWRPLPLSQAAKPERSPQEPGRSVTRLSGLTLQQESPVQSYPTHGDHFAADALTTALVGAGVLATGVATAWLLVSEPQDILETNVQAEDLVYLCEGEGSILCAYKGKARGWRGCLLQLPKDSPAGAAAAETALLRAKVQHALVSHAFETRFIEQSQLVALPVATVRAIDAHVLSARPQEQRMVKLAVQEHAEHHGQVIALRMGNLMEVPPSLGSDASPMVTVELPLGCGLKEVADLPSRHAMAWHLAQEGKPSGAPRCEPASFFAGSKDQLREALQASILPPSHCGSCRVGLNFADVFTGLALYGPIASGEVGSEAGGFVPGLEFSGVVERVGREAGRPGASRRHGGQLCELTEDVWQLAKKAAGELQEGDRVMGAMRFGSYATHVNVPAHQVMRIPDGWSFEEGAAFPVQSLTVFYAMRELGALRSRHTVLIHSAAGGCGLQAIEICLKLGAKVVGTVGSDAKVPVVLARFPSLKAEQIVVRKGNGLEAQLKGALAAVGADGFDIVLDAVLGEYFHPGFNCLAAGGRYVVYGAASMTPQRDSLGVLGWIELAWKWLRRPWVDPLELPGVNKSIMGFNLIHCFNNAEQLVELLQELLRLELPAPRVGHILPFGEAVEALRTFRSGQTTGKVVLQVDAAEK